MDVSPGQLECGNLLSPPAFKTLLVPFFASTNDSLSCGDGKKTMFVRGLVREGQEWAYHDKQIYHSAHIWGHLQTMACSFFSVEIKKERGFGGRVLRQTRKKKHHGAVCCCCCQPALFGSLCDWYEVV